MKSGDKLQAAVEISILHGYELNPPIRAGDKFIVNDIFEDFFEIENLETGQKYGFFTGEEIDTDFLTECEIRQLKLKKIDEYENL